MRYVLVILATFAVAACSSGSTGGDGTTGDDIPAGDGILPGDGTTTGDDLVGADVDYPKECQKDEDCAKKATDLGKDPADFACNCKFECVEVAPMKDGGCHIDKNCGSEAYCEPCSKTCKPKLLPCDTCESDFQCDPDTRCVGTFNYLGVGITMATRVCAPLCLMSTRVCTVEGAPVGSFVCADADVGDPKYGVCVPISLDCANTVEKCLEDADCADPKKEKCWQDLKICGCRDTLSCEFGFYCNRNTHKCVQGCTSDPECGKDRVCEAGECGEACTGSLATTNVQGCPAEPPQGFEDKAYDCIDGHCKIPGMCFQPTDCHDQETFCDADTHTCKTGCLIDFDCKTSAKICDKTTNPGHCVDRGCTGNFECGCGQVCKLDEEKCVTAEGKYCDACNQDDGEEACGDKATLCIGFKDPDTNEDKGSYCMPPCSQDPENLCPQGWQCQDVKDDKGVSHGKVCIRFCYKEVMGGCAMGNPPEKTPETAETAEEAPVSEGAIPDA